MNSAIPKLADVSCSPMRFLPGDRLLVRCQFSPSPAQVDSIKRTVQKWAGDHVEILVIDALAIEIELDRIAIAGK